MDNKRVDFFVVGAMRSGTSSIRDGLALNPHINMAKGEPKFFHNDKRVAEGYEEYHELFDWQNDYLLRGEKSPQYAVSIRAPEYLQAYNPQARLVWMFRNPVSRAISHYAHSMFRSGEAIPLRDAIDQRVELERSRSTMAYVFRSEYQKHMQHWFNFFPEAQHFVLILEEVIADPDTELRRLHEFLDVPCDNVAFPHTHKPQVKEIADGDPTLQDLRPQLGEILQPTIEWMESFLGRELPQWRTS